MNLFFQLPFDFTWKNLKDTFNTCGKCKPYTWVYPFLLSLIVFLKQNKTILSAGMVQYAEIKLENGKSKGCGVVRFDNPETAERVCRTMNGFRLNGREIDVRIDRNA